MPCPLTTPGVPVSLEGPWVDPCIPWIHPWNPLGPLLEPLDPPEGLDSESLIGVVVGRRMG